MDKTLEAIKDAMDKTTGDGRDDSKARELADQYVADNPAKFAQLATMSIHGCVAMVDLFREKGEEEALQLVETWLLHRFEKLNVGGPVQAKVRLPGATG